MDISVTHGEVYRFSQELRSWADQMKSTQQQIMSRTRQLETQWKDPQYRRFVEIAATQAKTLAIAIEVFESDSEQLKLMSRQLEETQKMMQQRLNNMNAR